MFYRYLVLASCGMSAMFFLFLSYLERNLKHSSDLSSGLENLTWPPRTRGAEHPNTSDVRNHIPTPTKLQFAARSADFINCNSIYILLNGLDNKYTDTEKLALDERKQLLTTSKPRRVGLQPKLEYSLTSIHRDPPFNPHPRLMASKSVAASD